MPTGTSTATGQAAESRLAQECTPPPLPGKVVDVDLTDTAGAAPMRLTVKPAKVTAGTVSLRASNTGTLAHEVVVLPLAAGKPIGKQPIGADSRVSETGSIGEASHNCAAGEGGGIAPGSAGWATLTLQPGRYELICNFPGHYAMGMRAELDVTQ
ncbi:plastocyanin/azurin family copper-binding protein [Nonomuraea sp. NPDC051941]|uniref:plastocyanin/azurin family copper-binding protein n=1 Tax=Nonomuraea sp. NPDC051941 TaxID=3364373 RepID=UPI0037C89340